MAVVIEPQEVRERRSAISLVTAYHEAGHAVIASALGQDVYWIGLDEDGGGVGHRPRREDGWVRFDERLAIVLGGPVAEARAAATDLAELPGRCDWWAYADDLESWVERVSDLIRFGASDAIEDCAPDEWRAASLLWGLVEVEELPAALRGARDRARRIVEAEWQDVQAIAACLFGGER